MTFARLLEPRDEKATARASTVLYLVGTAMLAGFLIFGAGPMSTAVRFWGWGICAGLLAMGLVQAVAPGPWLTRWGIWVATNVAAVLAIAGLGVLFPEHALLMPLLLCFPVVGAAAQMRTPVAVGITSLALVADAVVLLLAEPPAKALLYTLVTAPVPIVVSFLLVQAMDRQERLIDAVQEQARVDPLTGLLTRRGFTEAREETEGVWRRPGGTALLLVDVDEFKTINDTHGHPVGDQALSHVAAVLSSQVRADDALISRLGGDELAVLLPGCSAEAAARRAEQVVNAVRVAPLPLPDGSLLALSVSVGVAHAAQPRSGWREMYPTADVALYHAKKAGRNRFAVAGVPA